MKTETTRRAVMAGLAAAPVAGLPAIAGGVDAGDDAALLELGKRLEVAWAHESIAYSLIVDNQDDVGEELANEAKDRTSEIVDAIIEVKATTFEGLKIKARALSWCHCGDFEGIANSVGNIWFDERDEIQVGEPSKDRLVADSLLYDLIALAALDWGPQS
jgi:hypothetical protein